VAKKAGIIMAARSMPDYDIPYLNPPSRKIKNLVDPDKSG
jgi:hypothetical protein